MNSVTPSENISFNNQIKNTSSMDENLVNNKDLVNDPSYMNKDLVNDAGSMKEPDSMMNEPDSMMDEPNSIMDKPDSMIHEPNSMMNEPNSMVDKPDSIMNEPNFINKDEFSNKKKLDMNTQEEVLYDKLKLAEIDFYSGTNKDDTKLIETALYNCYYGDLQKSKISLFYNKKFFILFLEEEENNPKSRTPYAFFTATITSNYNLNYVTIWDLCRTYFGENEQDDICFLILNKFKEYLRKTNFIYKLPDRGYISSVTRQYKIHEIHIYVNVDDTKNLKNSNCYNRFNFRFIEPAVYEQAVDNKGVITTYRKMRYAVNNIDNTFNSNLLNSYFKPQNQENMIQNNNEQNLQSEMQYVPVPPVDYDNNNAILDETDAINNQPQSQPVQPTVEPPVQPSVEQPLQPTVEPPVQPSVEQPVQPSVEQPVQPSVEPSVQPSVEPPVQSSVEPPVQPTVEPPVQPSVEPPVQSSVEPPVQPTVEQPVQPSVEQPVQPTVEPPVQPTVEQSVQDKQTLLPSNPNENNQAMLDVPEPITNIEPNKAYGGKTKKKNKKSKNNKSKKNRSKKNKKKNKKSKHKRRSFRKRH